MIVTVTLNPWLQVRYDCDEVRLGTVNRVRRVRYAIGGRGLAIARLLQTFGHDVVAAGLVGGATGELIRNEVARAGVATQFTRIAAESRRLIRVEDSSAGCRTIFEEPPPYITTEELGRLATDYRGLLDEADAVVLSGTLPAGLPAEMYGSLTSYAAAAGVPVILDAAGTALQHGAARRPALVMPAVILPDAGPEAAEPGAGGSEAGGSEAGGSEAGGLKVAAGSSLVLQTAHGVRTLTTEGEWRAEAGPAAQGAGEQAADDYRAALVAGFVAGIALTWSWPDTLRHAVALAASVSAAGDTDLAAYEELLPGVTVTGPVAAARSEP